MEPEPKVTTGRRTSITIIAVVAIVVGAGVYLAKSLIDVPRDMAGQGREALE